MEPRVSLPKTSPTQRWTGEVGDASVFWVWGYRAFVRDTSVDKLFARAIPYVFLGFPPDAPGWQFYHPTSRRVFPSQNVTFDESVPFYRLFPYRSAPPPPPPLFLAPGPPPVDPLRPQGPAPSGVSRVDPLLGTVPVEVAVGSIAARGAASGGAASGSAGPGGAESEGAGSGGASLGMRSLGVLSLQVRSLRVLSLRVSSLRVLRVRVRSLGVLSLGVLLLLEVLRVFHHDCLPGRSLSPRRNCTSGLLSAPVFGVELQELESLQLVTPELEDLGFTKGSRAAETGIVGGVGAGGAGAGDPAEPEGAGVGGTGAGSVGGGGAGAGDTGAVGAGTGGAGAGGASAGGAGAGDTGTVDPGAAGAGSGSTGAGGNVRPRPYFVPLLQQVLGLPCSTGLTPPLLCPPPDESQPPLQPASSLPAPSPYTEQSGGLRERREPVSRPAPPVCAVCTGRRVPRPRPPPVPSTHTMTLRPSSVPLHVHMPSPPESSLPAIPDPESDLARAGSPNLVEFAPACRLDYAIALVAESESTSPPSVGGECALGMDVLEDRQEDFECLDPIMGPYSSQWQAAMDAETASWKSIGTYVDAVPPCRANIVDGMWIFRVKQPLGSPHAFKARYIARGFSQQQGADYFQTFSLTPKMTTLWVLLHVATQRDYELHSLDFSTVFLQGSLHEEIWLRRPPGFTGSFLAGTQRSLRRPVYGLRQAPHEWHVTLRTTLVALGFSPPTGSYPELVGCLMFLMTCTRPDLAYPLSLLARYMAAGTHRKVHWDAAKRVLRYLCSTSGMGLVLGGRGQLFSLEDASWVDDLATQRSSQGYTFSLGSGSVSWRSTRSSSVLSSSCEAEIYAGAMTAQELRWLTL
ncbi:unnamed protein product [Closterium sp. NIES-54]